MSLFLPSTARPSLHRLALAGLATLGVLLAACGERNVAAPGEAAARVNRDDVTVAQVNQVLQQQRGLRPEQAEAAGRQVLERLIDQQLALQKADELKLDREPRVMQQIEAARRDVLARAYVDKLGEGAAKPSAEEIKAYYESKPALFKERRVYNIQEIAIEAKPEQMSELRESLSSAKNIGEFIEFLKTKEFKFVGNQAVRAAEQLPLQNLESFARMKDGQALIVPTAAGAQVVVLAGSRSQPVTEEQARPAIEQYLVNERKRKLVEDDIRALRAAAKIEYLGKYAASAPGQAASVAASAASK